MYYLNNSMFMISLKGIATNLSEESVKVFVPVIESELEAVS